MALARRHAPTTGSPFVAILLEINLVAGVSVRAGVRVRVVDDAGVAAERTWAVVLNKPPVIAAVTVNPNPGVWPGISP